MNCECSSCEPWVHCELVAEVGCCVKACVRTAFGDVKLVGVCKSVGISACNGTEAGEVGLLPCVRGCDPGVGSPATDVV